MSVRLVKAHNLRGCKYEIICAKDNGNKATIFNVKRAIGNAERRDLSENLGNVWRNAIFFVWQLLYSLLALSPKK